MKGQFHFGLVRTPCLMGVLNMTPNSFSDGGRFYSVEEAVAWGRRLVGDGAAILDVGGEASSFFREGVVAVEGEEQWRRVGPVLEGMTEKLPRRHDGTTDEVGGWVSVDTRSALVAERGLLAGASIVNDISAGTFDGGMLETVARLGGAVVLMHIGESYPENPLADDAGIVERVRDYLGGRVEAAVRAGILRERIAVDPGVGFGKTMRDNWRLALGGKVLSELGVMMVLGASRKRFLERAPVDVSHEFIEEWEGLREKLEEGLERREHGRDVASAVLTVMAAKSGFGIHRVHDVAVAACALAL